jgi:hypothetical protein
MRSIGKHIASRLILAFAALFLALPVMSQKVEVSAKIDTNAIRIGDQVTLRLVAKYRGDQGELDIKWPKFKDTITGHIEIVEQGKVEKSIPDKSDPLSFVQQQTYIITSFDSGYQVIPPFRFIINNDTANVKETEPLLLEVQTVAVDTTVAIKDIKGIMSEPFDWHELIPYVMWGLAILAVIAVIVYITIRLIKKKPVVPEKPKVIVPPHVTALQALEKLRSEKLWQEGKIKQYHSALSDILRAYIEERFRVNALEQTTDEILIALRNVVVDEESKAKLKQVLRLADLVKFAKEQPLPNENELSMANAFDFVNGTKREEPKPGTGNELTKE